LEANVGKPQVAYRETITGESQAEGKYIKQSGGKGNYGHVKSKLNQWIMTVDAKKIFQRTQSAVVVLNLSTTSKEVLFQEFIPACEKGFKEGLDRGSSCGIQNG
jgi:elongation factor G